MKILVTGRHGQLARSLAERGGDEIHLMGRADLDLAVAGSARSAILAARPDLVVNAAAFTAVDLAESEEAAAHRINADGAGEVAGVARELGVPIIHISTDYVFDGRATAPYGETADTAPINAYGRTKLAGEGAVRAATPDHLILRTSWLISPFGKNFVRNMVDLGQQRETLSVVADQHGNPTSALDLADAILALAARWSSGDAVGEGETYHLAGPDAISWAGFAAKVMDQLRALGQPAANVRPIASADWPTKAPRPTNSTLDTGKYRRDVGAALPSLDASLEHVIRRLVAA